ncbi:NAD(P)/FAD-dependent oxidoreductase [Virgibacillus byunsanensis]|uniref:NAD(P)/FAD-dependent oxidoreductase n=1 Tax=Virgibacillus byunsanensis TaxID=570945 RepID=A0ABW3LP88_9BACI
MKYDLIVIGAGPAGMCASIEAASHGASVAIVDENPVSGGKLLGQLHEEEQKRWWIGKEIALKLEEKVNQLEITSFQEREVWGIFPRWQVMLNSGEHLQSKNVLIATGAAEKAIPIPGWTTPGVMAIGAAQVLTNYYRVKPGNKVAVVGVDPLSLSVAHEMKMAGINVVGIFLPPFNELSEGKSNPKQMISNLSSLAHLAPNPLLKVAGKMAQYTSVQHIGAKLYPPVGLKIWGIPLFLRKAVLEIEGVNQVESITIATVNSEGMVKQNTLKRVEVDCVCISGGLYPLSEIAGVAGCDSAYIDDLGGYIPLHNDEMETTQSGIFVAGNITGIEGAKVAMAQGELAGKSISVKLGLVKNGRDVIRKAQNKVENEREKAILTFQQNSKRGRKKSAQFWNKKQRVNKD